MWFPKNICIIDTSYALSLYLLYKPMRDIEATLFFVGDTIHPRIREKLPHAVYIPTKVQDWKSMCAWKMTQYVRWPYLLWCNIYAQDHIAYADILIGRRNYTLIEDAPGAFGQIRKVSFLQPFQPYKGDTIKRRIKYYLSHSAIFGQCFGTNNQCLKRLVTCPDDLSSEYIAGKPYELLSLQDLWMQSDETKKAYILQLFSVPAETLQRAKDVDLLILSQPFVEDCGLSPEEMIELYKPYVEKYKHVVIKVHPRDKFDYESYFPNVEIMTNQAPMQLLNAMGVVYPNALTVCSTALSAMPSETNRIYLGTKVNAKIYKIYGDLCN